MNKSRIRAYCIAKTIHALLETLDPSDRSKGTICTISALLMKAFTSMQKEEYDECWTYFENSFDNAKIAVGKSGVNIYALYSIGLLLDRNDTMQNELAEFFGVSIQKLEMLSRSLRKGKYLVKIIKNDFENEVAAASGARTMVDIVIKSINKEIYDRSKK